MKRRLKKPTILHLIESLGQGGAERRLVNDLKYLDATQFSSVVCHLYPPDSLKGEIASLEIPILWLGIKGFSEWPKGVVRLIQTVKTYKVDLLHTQLFGADVLGRIVGRFLKIPVVSNIQSSIYEPGVPYFKSSRQKWIDSWTGRWCNEKFIAVSHFVKESVQKKLHYKEEDIVVIPNGVDLQNFSPNGSQRELRRSFGWGEKDVLLICVGKLNPPKGQEYLIGALPLVKRCHPNVKLLIVGSGPRQEEWMKLSRRLGLEGIVFFLGDRSDVNSLLAMSDIFVFPTLSEGMPFALLEAMAMEKPCIASDIPPIREVIEDGKTGLLVRPRQAKSIAEAILNILNAPEQRVEMARRGRAVIVEKFSAESNVRLLETLYKDLLQASLRKNFHEN